MLTALGKALRVLRIERNLYLRDMAEAIGVSSAFLSAVETGTKRTPADLVARICTAYNLSSDDREKLEEAAAHSVNEVRMRVTNNRDRELVVAFAKRFPELDAEERRRLFEVLVPDGMKGAKG